MDWFPREARWRGWQVLVLDYRVFGGKVLPYPMSIDPVWLAGYQKRMADARLAVDDWVVCMELEELLEDPFEEEQ